MALMPETDAKVQWQLFIVGIVVKKPAQLAAEIMSWIDSQWVFTKYCLLKPALSD